MISSDSVNPSVTTVVDGHHGRVVKLAGGNFSGRSSFMAECVKLASQRGHLAVYLPPDLPVSGLMSSVEDELALHLGPRASASCHWKLAQEWGLTALGAQRLHHLSGGQTAMLVILCKLALMPRLLGLDGALEQLDPSNVQRVLTALSAKEALPDDAVVLIAHNGDLPVLLPSLACASETVTQAEVPRLRADHLTHKSFGRPVDVLVRDASFGYTSDLLVFQDLNLHLKAGHIYRLAGPNGAGKTTLALILLGHLRLRSGEIIAGGESTDPFKKPGSLASYHFQRPDDQLFESSVRMEVATLTSDLREQAIGFGSLDTEMDSHPFDLPFVLRKRLALSVVMPLQTPWLIVDEPTLGQDEANRAELAEALRAIACTGRGVLLITHDGTFAESVIDATIQLGTLSHDDSQRS
jgi:energy-coupling factor transport system ATP-binding protein